MCLLNTAAPSSLFSFLLFLPGKAETVPGLRAWGQVLMQAPQPAASHHPAPQELLLSSLGVLQDKHPCQLRILTLHLPPYTIQMDSNPQLPLIEALAWWELLGQCGSHHPVFAGWVWCSLDRAPRKHPKTTQKTPSTHQAQGPTPQTPRVRLSPHQQGL